MDLVKGKWCITVKECSELTGIGINRLYRIVRSDNCTFALKVGNKYLIKVKQFNEWLDSSEFA